MKQNIKNYLKFGMLLIGISLFFTCVKEDNVIIVDNSRIPVLDIRIEPYEHVKTKNKAIGLKIDKFIADESAQRSETSEIYGFTINDNNVQIIEFDNYTTYTFMIFRNNPEPNILENYVLKEFDDGSYQQSILRFAFTLDVENQIIYDTNYFEVQPIIDQDLLFSKEGCSPEFVEALEDMTCTFNLRCTGNSQHETAGECPCPNTPTTCFQPGTTVCDLKYVFTYNDCPGGLDPDDNSEENDNTETNNTTGGSTSNSNNDSDDTTNEEETSTVPFNDLSERKVQKECRKITDFLNDSDNAVFKQKLLDLASPANFASNLDVQFEKSITSHENSNELVEAQGNNGAAAVNLNYTITHPTNTEALVHTHPNDTDGTYSVFSFDDLIAISRILANDQLDTGTFVAYLVTKKGNDLTYYALTINNKTKFKEFFSTFNDSNYNYLTATQEEKDNRTESRRKIDLLRKKYYDDVANPLISQANTYRDLMLSQFLKFMEDADMGTTVFKTDENFNDFERVSYNTSSLNNIKEQDCNN